MANPSEYKTVQARNFLNQLMWTQIRVHDLDLGEILRQAVAESGDRSSPKAEQADQDMGALQNDIASEIGLARPAFSIRANSD